MDFTPSRIDSLPRRPQVHREISRYASIGFDMLLSASALRSSCGHLKTRLASIGRLVSLLTALSTSLSAATISVTFDFEITARNLTVMGNAGPLSQLYAGNHAPVTLTFDTATYFSYYFDYPIPGTPMPKEDRHRLFSVASLLLVPPGALLGIASAHVAEVTKPFGTPSFLDYLPPYSVTSSAYEAGPLVYFDGGPWDSSETSFSMSYGSTIIGVGLEDWLGRLRQTGESVTMSFTNYNFYSPGNFWVSTYNGQATLAEVPEPTTFAMTLITLAAIGGVRWKMRC